jgi:hypothetical protein
MKPIVKSNHFTDAESKCVASGEHGDVWLFGEALDEFRKLESRNDATSVREFAQLERYFERYVEHGQKGLNDKMFKSQKREANADGVQVKVWEFKAYQFRIYGIQQNVAGKACFMGTACDPSKKQDKADPQKIKKAAEQSSRIKK